MKKSTKVTIIASAAAVIGIAALIGVGVAVTTLFRTIGDNGNQYSATIERLEAARKSFNAGETAEIGLYDVTASIQKAYTPTEAEATAAQKVLDKKQRFNSINKYPDTYGYSLTQKTGQYVQVTLVLKYNQARDDYNDLSTSSKDWTRQLAELTLNDMRPILMTPDVSVYKTSQEAEASAKTDKGLTMTALYRIPKTATTFTLHYDITIFTKVSPIVGTEGMPSKSYEYTIGIQ